MAELTKRALSGDSHDGESASSHGGGENLDKVRDILFGAQLRDSEKRFARIEERLAKDVTELREETRKRLDTLEGFIKKEIQSLLDRVKAEQGQRTDSVKDLGQQLKDVGQQIKETTKGIEKRIGEVEDQTAESDRALREQILEQSKTLRDEIVQGSQEASASIQQAAGELREEKADRSVLANLFTEMAMRLADEPEPPARK